MRHVLLLALLASSVGCADVRNVLFHDDDSDDELDDAAGDDGIPDVAVTLEPDHVLLGPGEWQDIHVALPDGASVASASCDVPNVSVSVYGGDTVRVTNEGSETHQGPVKIYVLGAEGGEQEERARVRTWSGSGGFAYELDLTVRRGLYGNEPAELVAYRDATGFHARGAAAPGRYEIPLDTATPSTFVAVVCEAPNTFGTDSETIFVEVTNDDDHDLIVDCVSPAVVTHSLSGTIMNVPVTQFAFIKSFRTSTVGSAIYTLTGVPAEFDSEVVAFSTNNNVPQTWLYVPTGPLSSIVDLDFAGATPATSNVHSINGNFSPSVVVTMRTSKLTVFPVSAVTGTSFEFGSTSVVPGVYGLEARNTDSNAYSALTKIGSAGAIGDVLLPDPDLASFPVVGPAGDVTFGETGARHYVELTQTAGFDNRTARFFTDNPDATGFVYSLAISELEALTEWNTAWEITTGNVVVERIEVTTCGDRWMTVVSRPEALDTCTVERLGWTATF